MSIETEIKENKRDALLLRSVEEIFAFNAEGYNNAFLFAARYGTRQSLEILNAIIEKDAPDRRIAFIEATDQEQKNALMLAAISNDVEKLIFLKKNLNFDINQTATENKTALYYVTLEECTNSFDYLIRQGAAAHSSFELHLKDQNYFQKFKELIGHFSQKPVSFGVSILSIIKDISEKIHNLDQNGRKLKGGTEVRVQAHTFQENRERQLMRHVATQIYFSLTDSMFQKKLDIKRLVEVQIMHLMVGDKHNLFIAINKHTETPQLSDLLYRSDNIQENFHRLLTVSYTSQRLHDSEGDRRSKRFAKKLQDRILGNEIKLSTDQDGKDLQYATAIAKILRLSSFKPLSLCYANSLRKGFDDNTKATLQHVLLANADSIFVLDLKKLPASWEKRHAEEFLVDIAEFAKNIAMQKNLETYSAIAGKKRPCMGCSGRMKDNIDNFNPRPGRLWTQTMEHQNTPTMQKTLHTMVHSSSHITISGGIEWTDYDSGSDSDNEPITPIRAATKTPNRKASIAKTLSTPGETSSNSIETARALNSTPSAPKVFTSTPALSLSDSDITELLESFSPFSSTESMNISNDASSSVAKLNVVAAPVITPTTASQSPNNVVVTSDAAIISLNSVILKK